MSAFEFFFSGFSRVLHERSVSASAG